jgi:4-diphosphocytidyl-2-C-methyl-D-erythritol kinase
LMFAPFLERAPAKVNLALHVLGRRADGYHELDSIVAFADVCDTLLFEPSRSTSLTVTGPNGAGLSAGADNLVLRALHELRKHVRLPEMHITLEKVLPVAAGLGGGSADAAAALRGGLQTCGVELPVETLRQIALRIGADVPVCLASKVSRMQGVGEQISALAVPYEAIVLVNPGVPCSTAEIFTVLGLQAGQTHKTGLDPLDESTWRNDLAEPAIGVQPAIKNVLDLLRGMPAFSVVNMSGSGATCFGLLSDAAQAAAAAQEIAAAHPAWWVKAARLS